MCKSFLALKNRGASPIDACKIGRSLKLEVPTIIKLVREAYQLNLTQAKDCLVKADGFKDLNDYQGQLLKDISKEITNFD